MKQFIVFSHFVKDHIGVKLNSLKKNLWHVSAGDYFLYKIWISATIPHYTFTRLIITTC